MDPHRTTFAIPTYRLRDVGETVERYDDNFWHNGHSTRLIVFDDSSLATHEKYYPALERTRTHNELYYVGPREKAEFVRMLVHRVGRKLESVVKNLFRPSYGGNRNFTLMYTLGGFLVSADDDMRPDALIENSVESLADGEISRGKLMKAAGGGFTRRSFDVLGAFQDVIGHAVRDLPGNYATGEYLVDTATDLETNASRGILRESSLVLEKGAVAPDATVKIAQTSFYGFEADLFQQNVSRIVDDVMSQIQGALELWPTLVEICYFQRHTKDLPKVRVANVHLGAG